MNTIFMFYIFMKTIFNIIISMIIFFVNNYYFFFISKDFLYNIHK